MRTSGDIVSDSLKLAWVRRSETEVNKKVHEILAYLDLAELPPCARQQVARVEPGGDSADTPVETMRANGVTPSSAARVSLMMTSAAAPSFSGQQLPAVMRPSGRNTGLSVDTAS